MELIRSVVEGFAESDFESFRDAVVEARTLEELSQKAGRFGELLRDSIDPRMEVNLNELGAGTMVGSEFHGREGFLDFWRTWLEPWESYDVGFSDWEEVGDAVLYTLDVQARGRGSGVEVKAQMVHAWTVPGTTVTRLDMYPSRRRARAALERD